VRVDDCGARLGKIGAERRVWARRDGPNARAARRSVRVKVTVATWASPGTVEGS
jgi:hypothetical protein